MKKESWIIKIFLLSFFLAIIFSGITNFIGDNCNMIILAFITLKVCIIGIIFDAIGTSVLTCDEATFHAKSAKKIRGSKESVNLIKNDSVVANICNDVIGDVCGIVSGGLGAVLALNISIKYSLNHTLTAIIISAIISSITIGSKAIGKSIATKYDNDIIFFVGRVISIFKKK